MNNFSVMSINLCCWELSNFTPEQYGHTIPRRMPRVKAFLKKYSPDLIGTQETTLSWKLYLTEAFSEYGVIGEPRELIADPEHTVIMYKKERFDLIEWETFPLSESGEFGSLGWGEEYPRNCTWAHLRDKQSGREFVSVNTHLALTDLARIKMLEMIADKAKTFNLPIILTGDFNTTEDSESYKFCMTKFDDAKYLAADSDSGITWHNYQGAAFDGNPRYMSSPIDYVMLSKGDFNCHSLKILRDYDEENNLYLSDHYPIMARVEIK